MFLNKLVNILSVALAVVILLPGCGGAQSLAKRGDKMVEAGHYNEAADFYYQALTRNRNNLRARMGMIDAGQKSLNDRLDRFNRTNNMGQFRDAVNQYREAEAYHLKIRRVGVDLNIPDHYTQDYNRSKEIVLEELYDEAMVLMEEGRYEQANALLKEVKELDPNYRDAQDLSDVAFSKPLYLQGKVALENGAYRMAYDYFEQILQRTPNFKDTQSLQQEALAKGRTTVAIVPFENVSNEVNVEKRMSAYVLDELSRIPDPFLRFVDRGDMDKIIEEQQLSLSGIFNDETAIQVGELLGAQAIITGKVLEYKTFQGRPQSTRKTGYEGYQVQRRSPETGAIYYETRYKPVSYTEYSAANSVLITFQYKLLSLETGEVMVSRIIERESKDAVNYAAYDGNAAMLYPASGNARNASSAAKRQLDNTLRARRNLKSPTELSNALFNSISSELSREVSEYMSRQ